MSKSTVFYTIYKWKPLCQKIERYFTKEIFECCYDVKFSAHLRLLAEKYHVLIILLAIYTMKRYPHVKKMHWWMSPYELHFILFTLHTATMSLYFVFNSPIMFSLSLIVDSMPCYCKCFTLAEYFCTWEAEFIFQKHIYRGRTETPSSKRWKFFSDSYGSTNGLYGNSKRVLLYWSCRVSRHRTHNTCKNSPTGNNSYLNIFFQ